jgi:hypothetical protein
MTFWDTVVQVRPLLYYRETCPRSRGVSLVSSCMSLGVICRMPLTTAQAREVFTTFRIRDGRPALLYAGRFVTGPRMALAIGAAMAEVLLELLWKATGCSKQRHPR